MALTLLLKQISLDGDLYKVRAPYAELLAFIIICFINVKYIGAERILGNINISIYALIFITLLDFFTKNRFLYELLFSVIYFSMIYVVYLIRKID